MSLSAGTLGEPWAIHKLYIAKERLEKDYGLKGVVMPNALKGQEYLYEHPEARAADLMEAFQNKEIKAIFNAIGGDDTIRLLPYIDLKYGCARETVVQKLEEKYALTNEQAEEKVGLYWN